LYRSTILEIRIDAHQGIPLGRIQARDQGVLVTAVARQLDARDVRALRRKLFYQLPGAILAAVIDKKHPAVAGNLPRGHEALEERGHLPRGFWQDLLLVVAGNYNSQPNWYAHV
jgi:hypothetical protein